MTKTIEERLNEQLNEKDERIEELESELEAAEARVNGSNWGWCIPREIDDEHPTLPLPRLELVYSQLDERNGWGDLLIEYRLVKRHLLGHLVAIPLGSTSSRSGSHRKDILLDRRTGVPDFPFRDGAHAAFDAGHLGLRLFVIWPGHCVEATWLAEDYPQFAHGREARKNGGA